MKKILIYPYSKSYKTFIRHQELLKDKEIVGAVSPRGWGLENDSIRFNNGEIRVSCEFSEGLKNCTTVWFVEDDHFELPNQILWEKLQEAVHKHKQIIYTRFKNKSQYKKALQFIPEDQNLTLTTKIPKDYWSLRSTCYSINTPVLVVFGIEENTEKFEVQVSLKKKFTSIGYNVSSITSRQDSELLEMHSLPAFMFENEISETDKIIQYNHFVKYIELNERPELIIIGIPGGILPFNREINNHFGIMAYEISNAVPCDLSIMCLLYNTNFTGDYSEIKKSILEKFNFNTICCHLAAVTLDTKTLAEDGKRNFVTLDREFVQRKIQLYNKKDIMDLTNEVDLECAVNNVIESLSSD